MKLAIPAPTLLTGCLSLLCLLFANACERIPERVEITETRELSEHDSLPSLNVTAADRLGKSMLLTLHPKEWTQLPASAPRLTYFKFGENLEGEFSISALTSKDDEDFITPNINRWYKQMGQPPIEQAEILSLPRIRLLDQIALKVKIDGSFTPVGATEPQPGYRLIGAILQSNSVTFFAKMTGPADLVDSQEEMFNNFVQSAVLRPTNPMR